MVSRYFQPSCTCQTPSGYIFRLRVPEDLKTVFGKSEFRYSLRTGHLREANRKARCISVLLPQVFAEIRNSNPDQLSVKKVNQLVERVIQESLEKDARIQAQLGSAQEDLAAAAMASTTDGHRVIDRAFLDVPILPQNEKMADSRQKMSDNLAGISCNPP